MLSYAAYLRIYEPVTAFHEPDRSRWMAYADSPGRPRRRDSLLAEQAEALQRAIAAPQIVVPGREIEHAYVRRADGVTYICPWQTRLRCLLAYGRMLSAAGNQPSVTGPPEAGFPSVGQSSAGQSSIGQAGIGSPASQPAGTLFPGTVPLADDEETMAALARLEDDAARGQPPRLRILASPWTMPLAWFVPFTAAERWICVGREPDGPAGAATGEAIRALVYTTPMARARRRVARALTTLRSRSRDFADEALDPAQAEGELAEVGRWLAAFHPYSLVELDYGGLVHLLSDDALCGDQSVAELGAAIDGAARGECELAVAMFKRAHSRWRAFAEFELAN
ncbi:MAG: hypothetical protein WAK82_15610 [Streptosporangiaceae bacterium]